MRSARRTPWCVHGPGGVWPAWKLSCFRVDRGVSVLVQLGVGIADDLAHESAAGGEKDRVVYVPLARSVTQVRAPGRTAPWLAAQPSALGTTAATIGHPA